MSLIYSILKPVLRKASAGRAAMTREDFARQAEKKQRRNLTFSEFLKLFLEVIISVVLAWIFIKLR